MTVGCVHLAEECVTRTGGRGAAKGKLIVRTVPSIVSRDDQNQKYFHVHASALLQVVLALATAVRVSVDGACVTDGVLLHSRMS